MAKELPGTIDEAIGAYRAEFGTGPLYIRNLSPDGLYKILEWFFDKGKASGLSKHPAKQHGPCIPIP